MGTRTEDGANHPLYHGAAPSRQEQTTVEVKPGTIWTAASDGRDPRLVVVVPVSEETQDATDLDLTIDLNGWATGERSRRSRG